MGEIKAMGLTEIAVGFDYHMTGKYAKIGEDAKRTFEMIIGQINRAGGVKSLGGLRFRPVWADHKGKPELAAVQAEKLITEDDVVAIFGARLSSCTMRVAEVCERYRIPLIVGDASAVELTDSDFNWTFRVVPHEAMCSDALFTFLKEIQEKMRVKVEKLAYVYEDSLYGIGCAEEWKRNNADPELGGYKVVENISYPATTQDVTSEVLRLKAAKPDIVFMSSYAADAVLYTKTYRRLGFHPKAILTVAEHNKPEYISAISGTNLGEYYFNVSPWNIDVKKAKSKEVAKAYYKHYGVTPHVNCICWYSSFYTFYKALERTDSLRPDNIRRSLLTTEILSEEIPSVGGVRFDETGQNTRAGVVVTQFLDGKYRTVYPWNVASADVIFPALST